MITINSGTAAYLAVSFTDVNGDPAVPQSITYKIEDRTNNRIVKAETTVQTPATSIEIPILSSENVIYDTVNITEKRVIIVTATYSADDAIVQDYYYAIKNLNSVS